MSISLSGGVRWVAPDLLGRKCYSIRNASDTPSSGPSHSSLLGCLQLLHELGPLAADDGLVVLLRRRKKTLRLRLNSVDEVVGAVLLAAHGDDDGDDDAGVDEEDEVGGAAVVGHVAEAVAGGEEEAPDDADGGPDGAPLGAVGRHSGKLTCLRIGVLAAFQADSTYAELVLCLHRIVPLA